MLKAKWTKLTECLCRRPRIACALLSCVLVLTLYVVSGREILEFENFLSMRPYSAEEDIVEGYLVWNPKCHMLSKDPMDPTITQFVKKPKFESCSSGQLMTSVSRDTANGSFYVEINAKVAKAHKNPSCCWKPITRPKPASPPKGDWDTAISVGKCEDFKKRFYLPQDVEFALVTCRKGKSTVYENIHAIVNPAKVKDRLDQQQPQQQQQLHSAENTTEPDVAPPPPRKLSVLVLGIDSVSRLNFKRSMPRTEKYLRETEWYHLDGYNKMGENTFPNLMAILTGQNVTNSYDRCKPVAAFGLDRCPFIWYNFRAAGYVTAYGEDLASLSTFNYNKVGFVEPPTDYYLRPYVVAAEKLLKSKKRFSGKYCTGPVISVERIFDYAAEFARTFVRVPYFGFFWTNTVSHDDVNGLSSMDGRTLAMLERMQSDGTMNDTMIVFLSDHGMRWGGIRNTFVGWYEERLPFIYVRLPEWFREEEPRIHEAMRLNQHRLTSPYDLYETLRDVLIRGGGEANSSSGCPTCQSLFRPVAIERGCDDVGVAPHWCTCTAFATASNSDAIAVGGAKKFLAHVENIVKQYKDKNGKRLCSPLRLKKIHRVDRVVNVRRGAAANVTVTESSAVASDEGYFFMIEVTPGGAMYETTIRHHGGDNFTISEDETSRVNSYAGSSSCLEKGAKRYCHCAS